jgi:hypothetical protein
VISIGQFMIFSLSFHRFHFLKATRHLKLVFSQDLNFGVTSTIILSDFKQTAVASTLNFPYFPQNYFDGGI